jgi:DNA-directed RNA polymerase subunit L
MSQTPKVESVIVKNIEYDFSKIKTKTKVELLLPSKMGHRISFILSNVNVAIANALRRTVLMELKIKGLALDISEIATNDKEIVLGELSDRISLIALDQSVPLDTVFSLNFVNSSCENYMVARTKNLIQVGGKKLSVTPFSETYRLLELRPGKAIEIPRIYVVEGYGFEHSRFSITSNFEYQPRDFVGINFLNEKGNIINRMVKLVDLLKIMKDHRLSQNLGADDQLYKPRILVIPDKSYQKVVDKNTMERIKSFPVILEDVNIRTYSSLEANPQKFFLKFTTHGNIDPKEMMRIACDNIAERLEFLLVTDNLVIRQDTEKTKITIRGEDHTIGKLIEKTIFELDPSIGLINFTSKHPQIRTATVNIRHPEPLKIFNDAITNLIALFKNLRGQF